VQQFFVLYLQLTGIAGSDWQAWAKHESLSIQHGTARVWRDFI